MSYIDSLANISDISFDKFAEKAEFNDISQIFDNIKNKKVIIYGAGKVYNALNNPIVFLKHIFYFLVFGMFFQPHLFLYSLIPPPI